MIELVGRDKHVLEVGTSTGYMSRVLKQRGNTVVGVEIDPEAATVAKQYCDRFLNDDIESLLARDAFQESSFDAVILGDVLEHLKWPDKVIERLKSYLRPSGYLVVSMPNVAHGDIILNLLAGRFPYHDSGLLDITHLRFFGLEDIVKLFDGAGYKISNLQRVKVDVGCTETASDQVAVPEELLLGIRSLPHSNTYQFVFKAFRAEECPDPLELQEESLGKSFDAFITELRRLRAENSRLDAYLARLQTEFDQKAAWADRLNMDNARLSVENATLSNENASLRLLWAKATRWKRVLIFGALAPVDWIIGSTIIATELFGRLLRRFARRMPPTIVSDATRCSVIIVSWEGKDLLAESLPAVVQGLRSHGGDHEIIVLDNGSTDATEEYVHSQFPEVRVVRSERNEYFGGGNNIAVGEAKNDIVVLLNNDMVVQEGFLAPLLKPFQDGDVFAVASQVFLADPLKPREETGKTRAVFNGSDLEWRHDPVTESDDEQEYVPVFWGHGGAVALDRNKFRFLGGFDRIYDPFYVEDADLSYQAWKLGWRCLLAVRSRVIHKHRASTSRFGPQFISQIVCRNHELFIWKNFGDIEKITKHFMHSYRQRIRQAGVAGVGIRLQLRAIFGAIERLANVLLHRIRLARFIVRTDQEVFELSNPPVLPTSHEVDFCRPSSQEQLGPGWYAIENSGPKPYCWMGKEASLYLCAPSHVADLRLQGQVPPLSSYRAASLTLTVECGTDRAAFCLSAGPFDCTCKISRLLPGKPALIQLAVSKAISPSATEARALGLIFNRITLNPAARTIDSEARERNLPKVREACLGYSETVPDPRKRLLFVCAYVPGVGLHGGGNTMFHLIRKLSDRYRITALCLMEKEAEQKFIPLLQPFCERLEVLWRRQTLYARNPLGLKPPEIVYEFYHRGMQETVHEYLRSKTFDVVDCEYLQTAHFIQKYPEIPAVASHHEVYSMAHRNRYQSSPWFSTQRVSSFANWMRMLNYEERMFRRFYAVMVVTEQEREYLFHYMPGLRVYAHPTGVDCDFFSPSQELPQRGSVVFLGNFNHGPNVSGILWFLERVWHQVRERCPYSDLFVVGGNPTTSIRAWDGKNNVRITGWVEDVRPYLRRSSVFIAPMLEGVGLRGKILEAWAMARPVVGTSLALSGMETAKNRAAFVADDAESFAARVSDLLESETLASKMGICGRELVLESFSWDAFANLYDRVYRDAMHAGIKYPTIGRTSTAGI